MERVYSTTSLTATSGKDILNVIRDNAATVGWTVVDDQIEASSYVVLYSDGHTHNNGRLPCYVKCRHSTTFLMVDMWLYWDSAAHVGKGVMNVTGATTFGATSIGMLCDATTVNYINIKGNKDFIWFAVVRPSTSLIYNCCVLRIDNPMWDYIGEWQSDTSAGTNVVVQLGENQAALFRVGSTYRVISPVGHIDTAVVSNKDNVSDTITLGPLTYALPSGTLVGSYPFPWVSMGTAAIPVGTNSPMGVTYNTGTAYLATTALTNLISLDCGKGIQCQTTGNDWHNHNEVSLVPFTFYELGGGVHGTSSYIHYCDYGSPEDTIGINQLDTGSITTGTVSSFTDTNKAWNVDVLKGMAVIFTSGEQEETIRYIESNTVDTIIMDPDLPTVISGGVSYAVCEAFYILSDLPYANLAIRAVY